VDRRRAGRPLAAPRGLRRTDRAAQSPACRLDRAHLDRPRALAREPARAAADVRHRRAAGLLLGAREPLLSAALAALGFVANAVPLTPAGLGVGEAAFEQLFRWGGVAGAALLLVSWRLACMPIWAAGGLVYLRGGARQGIAPAATALERAG
jgi:hypothetical protein